MTTLTYKIKRFFAKKKTVYFCDASRRHGWEWTLNFFYDKENAQDWVKLCIKLSKMFKLSKTFKEKQSILKRLKDLNVDSPNYFNYRISKKHILSN